MEIKKAGKSDVKKLVELDQEANKEIKWWRPMGASEFFKLIDKGLVYITENKEGINGYINAKISDKQLMLDNIYIKKEFRGQGIAKGLIKKFITRFRSSEFKDITIHCPERLRKFYEKLGFKVTALVMKKKLLL
jgi:predicted GNAT family acetyltransferase